MGKNPDALSAKQVATLEWIRDGCPVVDGAVDASRRISASSLHRRKLVVVKGRGTTWKASITKAGTTWLEQHPTPDSEVFEGGPGDLFARVESAGGQLAIGADPAVKAAYQELIRQSHLSPARPKGWRLEMKGSGYWSGGPQRIALVRYWEDFVDLVPVPVPDHVARYHPLVKAFLADRDWQMVTRDHVSRAARILQAVVDEALRRGFGIVATEQAKQGLDSYRASEVGRGQLVLRAPGGMCAIRVRELSGPGGKPVQRYYGPRRSGQPQWLERRDTEFIGTGDLELIAEGPGIGFNAYRIRDSSTMTLDERLPRVFRRIDMERLESEWREQERERAAAERRRRWEAAMAMAKVAHEEQSRWDAFVATSRDWHAIRRHREFLACAREAAASLDGMAHDDLVAHLDFAERRLDELDPIANPTVILPRIPAPKPDDLKPFLDGWSPHGPDGFHR
jgi:hypothetical protein